MRPTLSLLALAAALLSGGASHAQSYLRHPHPHSSTERSPVFVGGGLQVAQAQGEFRDHVDYGLGFAGHLLYSPDPAGILALRLEGNLLVYGYETMRVPLSSTIGGRVLVDVNTSNNIAFLGVGPQLMAPSGRLRPYVNGTVGVGYFFTESSVEGSHNHEPFASTTNYDDVTLSYAAGGGLYVPLRGGPAPVALDLGLRYQWSRDVSYLREGSIEDLPGGAIAFRPVRSDADVLTFQVGVTAAVGRDRDHDWDRGRDRDRRCRRRCRR